jgi:regulator of sigma E protease
MLTLLHGIVAWAPLGLPAFALVFTLVVFFHELGHFLVARTFGTRIETFSIGFGKEVFGWTDRKGTRWKIAWLPLGGYVKFLGDEDVTSTTPDMEKINKLAQDQRAGVLLFKPLYQRALVAFAGPAANFVLAFVLYTLLFGGFGAKTLGTYIGSVQANSPAAVAGLRPGDKIVSVDGKSVTMFSQLPDVIGRSKSETLSITIERSGRPLTLEVKPRQIDTTDLYGTPLKIKGIGVGYGDEFPQNTVYIPVSLLQAPLYAGLQCVGIVESTFTMLGRIVSRHADASQLGGPIGMAQMAQSAASHGLYDLISLIAFISVSIGLINLFPIPLLDGGHLLYYGCEAVLGRPLNERAQDIGFRVGLALVLGLMIFTTWNDLVR